MVSRRVVRFKLKYCQLFTILRFVSHRDAQRCSQITLLDSFTIVKRPFISLSSRVHQYCSSVWQVSFSLSHRSPLRFRISLLIFQCDC